MAKIKVTVKLPSIDRIKEGLKSTRNQSLIGNYLVNEMKYFIEKGISPVKGEGKFEAYSGVKDKSQSQKKSRQLKKVAKSIVSQKAKDKIQRRISAHKGVQTRASRYKYPYNVQKQYPDKRASPVNLHLSGDMLKALTFKLFGNIIRIGVFEPKMVERGLQHQYGNEKKSLPRRRFVPVIKEGDDFLVSIRTGLKDLYATILDTILKKSK